MRGHVIIGAYDDVSDMDRPVNVVCCYRPNAFSGYIDQPVWHLLSHSISLAALIASAYVSIDCMRSYGAIPGRHDADLISIHDLVDL